MNGKKKGKASKRNEEGELRRGKEGIEPVRISLMTLFCSPLVQ